MLPGLALQGKFLPLMNIYSDTDLLTMEVPSPQDLLVFKRSTHLTVQDWILVLAPSYNESASKSQSRAAAQSKMNQNISTENQCWFITKNKIKLRSLRGNKCLLLTVCSVPATFCSFSWQGWPATPLSHAALNVSARGKGRKASSASGIADQPTDHSRLCGKSSWGDLSLKKSHFLPQS